MQIARGKSPTESGLLTIPMVVGLFVASTVIGRRVSRTGRYKHVMLLGTGLLTVGLALMGTLDETTILVELERVHAPRRRRPRDADAEPRARRPERRPHTRASAPAAR